MLQSEYEHMYDHITLDNMHKMVRVPTGSVVIEYFEYRGNFIGRNPFGNGSITMHSYKVYSAGQSGYYKTMGGNTLYTEDNKPSVFRLP